MHKRNLLFRIYSQTRDFVYGRLVPASAVRINKCTKKEISDQIRTIESRTVLFQI